MGLQERDTWIRPVRREPDRSFGFGLMAPDNAAWPLSLRGLCLIRPFEGTFSDNYIRCSARITLVKCEDSADPGHS